MTGQQPFRKGVAFPKRFDVTRCGGAREAKGAGLKILWCRPSWVQIPPPANDIGFESDL